MAKTDKKSAQADHRGDNAAHEPRDGNGQFAKGSSLHLPEVGLPDLTARNAALGALGAGLAVAAVAAGSALFKSWNARNAAADGSDTSDLAPGADVIDDEKRDAFAPATMPAPSPQEAMGNGAA